MDKVEMLGAGIARLNAEAEALRGEIARLEQAKQTPTVARDLLHAQQALQLATVHAEVLSEEMEVIGIALVAHIAAIAGLRPNGIAS